MVPSVIAVIVTYFPEAGLSECLHALLPQVGHIILVDNGSDEASLKPVLEVQKQHSEQIQLILNGANLGLAKAQNIGIEHALKQGANWVLLLDDDSLPAQDMIKTLLESPELHPPEKPIGILAPHLDQPAMRGETKYVVPFLGVGFRRVTFDHQCERSVLRVPCSEKKYRTQSTVHRARLWIASSAPPPRNDILDSTSAVIASGSLIPREVIEKVGMMDESFFIDYVDTDFALRVKRAGYIIRVVKEARLIHHLGAKVNHTLAGKTIVTANHSPQRRYTIFRNRAVVWKRYWFSSTHYILYDMLAALFDLFRIMAFERQKAAKLGNATKGLMHGVMGKLDRNPFVK